MSTTVHVVEADHDSNGNRLCDFGHCDQAARTITWYTSSADPAERTNLAAYCPRHRAVIHGVGDTIIGEWPIVNQGVQP